MHDPERNSAEQDIFAMPSSLSEQLVHDQAKLIVGYADSLLEGQDCSISWEREYIGTDVTINIERNAHAVFSEGEIYVQENVPIATMVTADFLLRDGYADRGEFGLVVFDDGLVYAQEAGSQVDNPPLYRVSLDSLVAVEEFLEHSLLSISSEDDRHLIRPNQEELLVYLTRAVAQSFVESNKMPDPKARLDADLLRRLTVRGLAAKPAASITRLFHRYGTGTEAEELLAISRFPYASADHKSDNAEIRLNWTRKNYHSVWLIGGLTVKADGNVEVLGNPLASESRSSAGTPMKLRHPAQPAELARFLQLLQDPDLMMQ